MTVGCCVEPALGAFEFTVPGDEQLTSTFFVCVTLPDVTVTVSVPACFTGVFSEAVASPPSVLTVPVIMPNGATLNDTLVSLSTGIPLASRTFTVKFVALAQVAEA